MLPQLSRKDIHDRVCGTLRGIVKKDMNVLDVGCGCGITTKFISELGATVTGIDIAGGLIDYATEHNMTDGVSYINFDFMDVLLQEHFDLITLIDVMEHIPKDRIDDFMKAVADHSNAETTIYLNIPDGRFLRYMIKYHPRLLQIIDNPYMPRQVISMFGTIGYEPIEIRMYGVDCPYQYNEYVFIKTKKLFELYNDGLHIE